VEKRAFSRCYAPHLSTPAVPACPMSLPRVVRPDRGMHGERIAAGERASSRVGSSVSFRGTNSLKMRHAREGGATERDEGRRDEQVSAEKWVSRTGVSAGEYHIATLRRGLWRA